MTIVETITERQDRGSAENLGSRWLGFASSTSAKLSFSRLQLVGLLGSVLRLFSSNLASAHFSA